MRFRQSLQDLPCDAERGLLRLDLLDRHLDDRRIERLRDRRLRGGRRYLVNAGSVGQPRDGNPAALRHKSLIKIECFADLAIASSNLTTCGSLR